jgi:hypothetical protein
MDLEKLGCADSGQNEKVKKILNLIIKTIN